MQTSNQNTRHFRHLKPLVATAALLYFLVNAFLILCLAHPRDVHSHTPADEHFDFVCVWVEKAVTSHTPSAAVALPAVEAVFFILLLLPLPSPLIRAVQVTGRSPPNTPFFA